MTERDAEHHDRQPREPDNDARDGHPVSLLRAVGSLDLLAGDEAEDDAEECRYKEKESAAPADQCGDRQPVRLALGYLAVGVSGIGTIR